MADGDNLDGDTCLPILPDDMRLWHRILCVLGYHKPEIRINNNPNQCWGERSRLRDACGRCGTYLHTSIKDAARMADARKYAERTYPMPEPRRAERQDYISGIRHKKDRSSDQPAPSPEASS